MKPIDQTMFVNECGDGNCLQAAIASILELPLSDVPHFHDKEWYDKMEKFINAAGYDLIDWPEHESGKYLLVFGKTIRETSHAVVYKDGKLAHDPHPSRNGITEMTYCAELKPKP